MVVEGFQAEFVGGEQVFEHLLHGHAAAVEAFGVVAGVGGNSLIDKFLHDADQFQVAVVAAHLPQGFVLVFQALEFGHDLFEDTVFGGFHADQAAWGLDAVGGVGDLRAGFAGHECGEGGVAQAVLDNVGTQGFPIVVQGLAADAVEVFFVGVDGQHAFGVHGLAEQGAGTVFFGQLHGSFEQVVLHGFEGAVGESEGGIVAVAHAVFGQIIGVVDHADAQGAAVHGGFAGGGDGVVLVVEQGIERAHGEVGKVFQLV